MRVVFASRKRKDAQTLVFFLLAWGTIMLLCGLAIDSGLLYLAKARMSRAVDVYRVGITKARSVDAANPIARQRPRKRRSRQSSVNPAISRSRRRRGEPWWSTSARSRSVSLNSGPRVGISLVAIRIWAQLLSFTQRRLPWKDAVWAILRVQPLL